MQNLPNLDQVSTLAWMAGFLEGEGCFGYYKYAEVKGRKYYRPQIVAASTDKDVMLKLASMFDASVSPPREQHGKGSKPMYYVFIGGKKASGWMMTLYTLMGSRRQAKIREVLSQWRLSQPLN